MSIADVDAALRDLDQTITRRNTNLDAFMRDIGREINHILDQLAECDRAVASGLAPPADLQRILDEIRRLITEVERIPLDDAKKDEILARLRREYHNRSIRRSAPYSSAPGPSSSSSSVSPAPGARSGVFSGFNLFSSPSSASSSPVPGSSSASPGASPFGPPSSDIELSAPKGVGKEGTLLRPPSSGLNPLLSPPPLGPAKPLFGDDDDDDDDYHGPAIRPDDVPKSSAFDVVSADVQRRKHERDLFASKGTAIGGKKSKRNKKYRKKTRR